MNSIKPEEFRRANIFTEEDNIYLREIREHMIEDEDALSAIDDGFMLGYEEGLAEFRDREYEERALDDGEIL
jgi:hypothetical protein